MRRIAVSLVFVWFLGRPLGATAEPSGPVKLDEIGIDQRLNAQIPLSVRFRDEMGRSVPLGDFFGDRPVVLSFVYYGCPMLCSEVLDGLVRTVRAVDFDVGEEYRILTVSFDPNDGPELAVQKKDRYLGIYGRAGAETGWQFLTGTPEAIEALTEAVGFRYVHDEISGQYAHASGIVVLTPRGKISRYFYGIEYPPRDLRMGLMEASSGNIGSPVDQLILYCYHYDPTTGRYGLVIMNVLRLAGVATVLGLGAFVGIALWRERRRAVAGS